MIFQSLSLYFNSHIGSNEFLKIKKNLKINPNNILKYSSGKIEIQNIKKKEMKKLVSNLSNKHKFSKDNEIIGFGVTNSINIISIYFKFLSSITKILNTEIIQLITELGLFSSKTQEIANLVSNEILTRISIDYDVNGRSFFLTSSISFTGCFVLNEKIKKQMIDTYTKELNKIMHTLKGTNNPKLDRFVTIIKKQSLDLPTALLAGLITEASLRVILSLTEILHNEKGQDDISSLDLNAVIVKKVKSRKEFSARELSKMIRQPEWFLISHLNMLRQLKLVKLVDKELGVYVGTRVEKFPRVMGARNSRLSLKKASCSFFHNMLSIKFKEDGPSSWTHDEDDGLYADIFPDNENAH